MPQKMPLNGQADAFVLARPIAAPGTIQAAIGADVQVEGVIVTEIFANIYPRWFANAEAYCPVVYTAPRPSRLPPTSPIEPVT